MRRWQVILPCRYHLLLIAMPQRPRAPAGGGVAAAVGAGPVRDGRLAGRVVGGLLAMRARRLCVVVVVHQVVLDVRQVVLQVRRVRRQRGQQRRVRAARGARPALRLLLAVPAVAALPPLALLRLLARHGPVGVRAEHHAGHVGAGAGGAAGLLVHHLLRRRVEAEAVVPVSYTHLTLPTN